MFGLFWLWFLIWFIYILFLQLFDWMFFKILFCQYLLLNAISVGFWNYLFAEVNIWFVNSTISFVKFNYKIKAILFMIGFEWNVWFRWGTNFFNVFLRIGITTWYQQLLDMKSRASFNRASPKVLEVTNPYFWQVKSAQVHRFLCCKYDNILLHTILCELSVTWWCLAFTGATPQ